MNSNAINTYKCNIYNDGHISEIKGHLLVHQYERLGRLILIEKPLKYNEKYAAAVRKHCHLQIRPADSNLINLPC